MNQDDFQIWTTAARERERRAATPEEAGYWKGYQLGLRRNYHGERLQVDHEAMMALGDDHGHGYRDGYAGKSMHDVLKELAAPDSATCEITVTRDGGLVLFRPLTAATETWLRKHTEGRWLGGALVVDPRDAGDLAETLRMMGFTVADND